MSLGGGIVFDSDPYEEYVETLNKLKSNVTTITKAEEKYIRLQSNLTSTVSISAPTIPDSTVPGGKAHIDLAAG